MSTKTVRITVSDIPILVHRKTIKNLHVGVYPPDGRVRVAAPLRLEDEAIRLAIIARLPWIRRQQRDFARQVRQSAREMVTGESHYYRGRRYRLDVVPHDGRPSVSIRNAGTLEMKAPPAMDTEARRALLERWYRRQLKAQLPLLLDDWQEKMGVAVRDCRIKRMKTRWGSCNIEAGRIWLNLELVKKPESCLEYIVVHEMVHLLERHHTDRFRQLMDRFLPDWRLRRDALNEAPLAHEGWTY